MFYYVYILQSIKNSSLYIGYTSDLKIRFKQHNAGESRATKPFVPWKLIYYEGYLNKIDAKNRDEYLKGGYGRRTIRTMLRRYLKNTSNQVRGENIHWYYFYSNDFGNMIIGNCNKIKWWHDINLFL